MGGICEQYLESIEELKQVDKKKHCLQQAVWQERGVTTWKQLWVNKKTLSLWHEHLPPPSPSCRDVVGNADSEHKNDK